MSALAKTQDALHLSLWVAFALLLLSAAALLRKRRKAPALADAS